MKNIQKFYQEKFLQEIKKIKKNNLFIFLKNIIFF